MVQRVSFRVPEKASTRCAWLQVPGWHRSGTECESNDEKGGVVLVEADLVIIVLEEHQVYDAVRCFALYKPVFVGGRRLKGEQAEAITQRLLFIALCQQGGGLVVPVIPIECAHFHMRFMFDEVTLRVW